MKRYRLKSVLAIASVASFLVGGQACTDLDAEVFDQAEASKFPANEEELLSTIGSTYGQLRGILGDVYALNEVTTDELVVPTRGPDWYDNGSWQQMARHEWSPVSPGQINGAWEWAYRVIAGANINLAALEESELQVEGKETIIAELRVMRAFAYFWLMDMFGNVPIITEDSPVGNPVQNTRQEVYDFIEKEITEALPNLRDEANVNTYSRFTKGAANTLLAKLYMNAQVYTGNPQWQKALDATEAVINSPAGYELNPVYLDNFAIDNGNDEIAYKENIFAIPYDKVFAGGMNMHMRTLHYAQGAAYGLSSNPWNGFATRAEFYNKFSDEDQRKAMWLEGPQLNAAGEVITFVDAVDGELKDLVFTPEINSLEKAFGNEGVRNVKYEVQRNNSRNDQDNDLAVFRLADVLLMHAEALVRLGREGEAVEFVNKVRDRAGVDPIATVTLESLLEERGRELAWEGWRRNDLIRFGKYISGTWQFKNASEPYRDLFPIPSQQLSNNPNLKQNPGY